METRGGLFAVSRRNTYDNVIDIYKQTDLFTFIDECRKFR